MALLNHYLLGEFFFFSFCLNKKKQKFKTIRQPPFAPQKLPRMVVRTELPKACRTNTNI
jgi:hypothetical protein